MIGKIFVVLKYRINSQLMLKILLNVFNTKMEVTSLSELDAVYEKAISQLSFRERQNYLERLLNRTEFDLQKTQCKKNIKNWNILKKAATKELLTIKEERIKKPTE